MWRAGRNDGVTFGRRRCSCRAQVRCAERSCTESAPNALAAHWVRARSGLRASALQAGDSWCRGRDSRNMHTWLILSEGGRHFPLRSGGLSCQALQAVSAPGEEGAGRMPLRRGVPGARGRQRLPPRFFCGSSVCRNGNRQAKATGRSGGAFVLKMCRLVDSPKYYLSLT